MIVFRSVDGVVSGRYAATTAGAPSVVLNASNQPISATVGLLGGTSHSYNPTLTAVNGSWHHPNLTGHRVAVTNTSGAKVGSTTVYDPDGMLVAGVLPDDKPGSFDAAWHGGGGVNLEHQAGVHPMVQMGARQYSPILARFLSVDPVEGGVNNDYGYVADPINEHDLTGRDVSGFCVNGTIGAFLIATVSGCFLRDDEGWAFMGTFSWGGGIGLGASFSSFYSGGAERVDDLRNSGKPSQKVVCIGISVLEYGGELCVPSGRRSRAPRTIQIGLGVGVGEISVRPQNYTGVTRLGKNSKLLAVALAAYRVVK